MSAATVTGQRSPWAVRGALIGLLVVLGVVGLLVTIALRSSVERGRFDPDAPTPQGSRALAVLLGQHGHRVTEVSNVADALRRARAGDATVLVAFPFNLGSQSIKKLTALPSSDRVVLVEPDAFTLDDLGNGLSDAGGDVDETKEPHCDLPEARSAGNADIGGNTYTSSRAGFTSCYDRSLGVLTRADGAELVLLGNGRFLTNDALADHGNAALALGLLTAHRDVVWLQQTTLESTAAGPGGTSLAELLPGWVPSTIWMLIAAGALAAFWRGRRLSAPVAEPLPVVVRSTETVEGRARLYQRAKARPEAADALRSAALARLRPLLGVGSQPEPADVRDAAAERAGWPAETISHLLYGPPPDDDRTLIELADGLDALVAAVTATGKQTVPTDEGHPS